MNKRDKKVFKIAFEEGYNKGSQAVAAKSYSRGYAKGLRKSTVIRVREHTFITIPSNDEKEWESKINWFAWAAIISLILFGITAELYAHNWNTTQDCRTENTILGVQLNASHRDAVNMYEQYQKCINNQVPIITEIQWGVCTP